MLGFYLVLATVIFAFAGFGSAEGREGDKGRGITKATRIEQRNERLRSASRTITEIAPFKVTPFPYDGMIPGKGKPFLDVVDGERKGHTSRTGDVYWQDQTYSDRSVLMHIPKGFNPNLPGVLIVYFHGNQAKLARDVVKRQRVPEQVSRAGLNAVLVAPQFAVDALDSSAGRFWQPGVFAAFLEETSERLASLMKQPASRDAFRKMPVLIVAYSGGYVPALYAVSQGGTPERVCGIVLLDALYSDEDRFAAWIAGRRNKAFLISAYSLSSKDHNTLLRQSLSARGVDYKEKLPSHVTAGTVTLISTDDDVNHNDFVTKAWEPNPLSAILTRIPEFSIYRRR
jgi:hypothetical protein